MNVDLRELQFFVTVAEIGSFTDAAADLHVSQAAVSRTIASLERSVGNRLLRREPRGCSLTTFGQQLLPQARRVLTEVANLRRLALAERRTLRLGYAWAAVGRHTTPLQRGWSESFPDTELQLMRHNSATAGLAEGQCEVAVVRVAVDERRFDSVVIGLEKRLCAFASDDPQWSKRRSIRMSEIAQRPVLTDLRTGTTNASLWPGNTGPATFIDTSDVDEWLDAIAAGKGVGTTSEATAFHYPRPGVSYRAISDGPRIPVSLAWWRDDPPPRLASLIDMLTRLYHSV